MKLGKIAWWLLIIGGLNWLLVGLFEKDIFILLGISMSMWVARVVYILVGLSAVYKLFAKKPAM